jgi:hypothetical protein
LASRWREQRERERREREATRGKTEHERNPSFDIASDVERWSFERVVFPMIKRKSSVTD